MFTYATFLRVLQAFLKALAFMFAFVFSLLLLLIRPAKPFGLWPNIFVFVAACVFVVLQTIGWVNRDGIWVGWNRVREVVVEEVEEEVDEEVMAGLSL